MYKVGSPQLMIQSTEVLLCEAKVLWWLAMGTWQATEYSILQTND